MATDSRANNLILIDTNLPDNTTELITPLKLREVFYNINDSAFYKVDEPRPQVFYMSSNDTVSSGEPFQGPITIDPLSELLSGNIVDGFYEYSTDDITYISVGGSDTLSDLIAFITGNTGAFYIRSYADFGSNQGFGSTRFTYY